MANNEHANEPGSSRSDRLIPLGDLRKVVGISRSKIYDLLQQGSFPRPVKVGRSNYFSEQELQGWIAAQLERRPKGGAR